MFSYEVLGAYCFSADPGVTFVVVVKRSYNDGLDISVGHAKESIIFYCAWHIFKVSTDCGLK